MNTTNQLLERLERCIGKSVKIYVDIKEKTSFYGVLESIEDNIVTLKLPTLRYDSRLKESTLIIDVDNITAFEIVEYSRMGE